MHQIFFFFFSGRNHFSYYKMQRNIQLHSVIIMLNVLVWTRFFCCLKMKSVLNILDYFLKLFEIFSWNYSLSKICKIVLEYTLKCSQLILSSDNKKILLTTKIARLDSGRNATKYYFQSQWGNLQGTWTHCEVLWNNLVLL